MKTKTAVVIALVGVVCLTNSGSIFAAQGLAEPPPSTGEEPPGGDDQPIIEPNRGDGTTQGGSPGNTIAVEATVKEFRHYTRAQHVANGVALRNRSSGTIHLRGVPAGRRVLDAYLYWNVSDTAAVGAATAIALFDGNAVTGTKTADNVDPCWGMAGNHTYRAKVNTFMSTTNPNQDYEVVLAAAGDTSGQNPWLTSPGTKREGATLVVIFTGVPSSKAVVIYDALSGTEFGGSLSVTLIHPISLSGVGLYTMSGADGQRGTGHDNGSSNETGFFNGFQISGPPVAASDWDGSAGLPLPQLWDVHTHIVSFTAASSTVSYSSGPDCLVPVVFVLEATTP